MRGNRAIHGLAWAAIAGALCLVYFSDHYWPARPDARRHASLGRALAQEVLTHWKPGAALMLITREAREFRHPEGAAMLQGFETALAQANAPITARQVLEVDPLRALEVPPGDFYEVLRKTPAGGVVVSFLGPPQLSADQRARLGPPRCSVIAFCPGSIPQRSRLRALLESGMVTSALVESADTTGLGYHVVRAADAASLGELPAEGEAP